MGHIRKAAMAQDSQKTAAPVGERPAKTGKIGFWAPATVVAFIVLTLVATYFVRKHLLERAMANAVERGDRAAIEELADSFPCPVNARTEDGLTPLHWAVNCRDCALVKTLLAKGADANAQGAGVWTPLHIAAHRGLMDIAEALLAHGADVNAASQDGWVPLHAAAQEGRKELAEFLIAKGADVALKDKLGETPLGMAVRNGQEAVAEVLRKAGAKE